MRWPTRIAVGGAVAIGAVVVVDALVETDQERIEAYLDEVVGDVDAAMLDRALAWVDPQRQAFEVTYLGQLRVFDASRGGELPEFAQDRLRPYFGSHLRELQRGVVVEDDRAECSLRLLSERGMIRVSLDLVRLDSDWLIRRVQIGR